MATVIAVSLTTRHDGHAHAGVGRVQFGDTDVAPVAVWAVGTRTSGVSTRCSARNQACISSVRMTSAPAGRWCRRRPAAARAAASCASIRISRAPPAAARASPAPPRRRRAGADPGDLRDVPRVADRDPAQGLHPFGDLVDQLQLLGRVLVEQQVQLVEGRAAHEPVVLLVQRVQDLGVGEDPVEPLRRVEPRLRGQRDRELPHRAELLDLPALLMQQRLATRRRCHRSPPCPARWSSPLRLQHAAALAASAGERKNFATAAAPDRRRPPVRNRTLRTLGGPDAWWGEPCATSHAPDAVGASGRRWPGRWSRSGRRTVMNRRADPPPDPPPAAGFYVRDGRLYDARHHDFVMRGVGHMSTAATPSRHPGCWRTPRPWAPTPCAHRSAGPA